MKEYIFVFGREPELSYLELISYFQAYNIPYKVVEFEKEIGIFLLKDLNFDTLIKRLGGTVKIGEVFREYKYQGDKNKLNYGISAYKGNPGELKNYLEKEFKKEKVKAMRRKPREVVFSPSEVFSKDLMEFIVYGKYWARTVAVFNPKLYMERDETRPRQMLLHQVSIRLARILVNLSYARNTLIDPFCGVGTILQEAMISGLEVYGMDVDKESVDACNENLRWLKDKYNLKSNFNVILGDSTKLTRYLKRNLVEGAATEPYMGPYYKKMPQRREIEKVVKDLEKLYYEFLLQLRQILKKNGKAAIVIPRLKFFGGQMSLNFEQILKDTGFEIFYADKQIKLPIVSRGKFLDRLIYVLRVK